MDLRRYPEGHHFPTLPWPSWGLPFVLWNWEMHQLIQWNSWPHRGKKDLKRPREHPGIWGLEFLFILLAMWMSPVLLWSPSSRKIFSKSATSDYSKFFSTILFGREGRANVHSTTLFSKYCWPTYLFTHSFLHTSSKYFSVVSMCQALVQVLGRHEWTKQIKPLTHRAYILETEESQ